MKNKQKETKNEAFLNFFSPSVTFGDTSLIRGRRGKSGSLTVYNTPDVKPSGVSFWYVFGKDIGDVRITYIIRLDSTNQIQNTIILKECQLIITIIIYKSK